MTVGQYEILYLTTNPPIRWVAKHKRTGHTIRGESQSKSGASMQILNEIARIAASEGA